MQHWLDSMTDLSAIKGDEKIVKQALAHLTKQAGFQGYAYLHIQPGYTIAASNYHPDWREKYFRQNFAAVDPVVKRAKSLKQLFIWSGEQNRHHLSKAERAFYAEAADFGIRSGITIPVKAANGSTAIFTLASEKLRSSLNVISIVWRPPRLAGQLHPNVFLAVDAGCSVPSLAGSQGSRLSQLDLCRQDDGGSRRSGGRQVQFRQKQARRSQKALRNPHHAAPGCAGNPGRPYLSKGVNCRMRLGYNLEFQAAYSGRSSACASRSWRPRIRDAARRQQLFQFYGLVAMPGTIDQPSPRVFCGAELH